MHNVKKQKINNKTGSQPQVHSLHLVVPFDKQIGASYCFWFFAINSLFYLSENTMFQAASRLL